MKTFLASFLLFVSTALFLTSCKDEVVEVKPDLPTDEAKHETITLGGGCYWCVEAVFQQLEGVVSATSGFMGGHLPNPTYEDVVRQVTGHIEVVQVVYDPKIISTEKILEWFWKAHNPTDTLGQGVDQGPMYMSTIFTHSEEQHKIAEASKKAEQDKLVDAIVTTIREAEEFYKVGEDQQDYYFRMKGQNRYCPQQITPKLKKLGLDY